MKTTTKQMEPSTPGTPLEAPGGPAELNEDHVTRRDALRKVRRYARYTAPVIVSLALATPAWASHDQGLGKSEA